MTVGAEHPTVWRVLVDDPDDRFWTTVCRRLRGSGRLHLDWTPSTSTEEPAHLIIRRADGGILPCCPGGEPLAGCWTWERCEPGTVEVLCALAWERGRRQALSESLARLEDRLRWEGTELGLPQRALLERHLHQAVARATRLGIRVALVEVELSRSPDLDVVLEAEAVRHCRLEALRRLRERLGPANGLAAHGRHGFLAMVTDLPRDRLGMQRLHDLARSLEAALARPCAGGICLRPLIGVAAYPDHGSDALSLMRQAGGALSAARRGVGRSLRFARREDLDGVSVSVRDEIEARRRLSDGSWWLALQGQFRPDGGRPAGVEVLVRTEGLTPSRFIAALSRIGELPRFGRELRERLARARPRIREQLGETVRISVNLAPEELGSGLARELDGVAPLTLEVTEDGHLDADREQVIAGLAEAGHELALDDFGTGMASLARLTRLPFRELKLDRSLLPTDTEDARGYALVNGTLATARDLGLRVVVEGVEDRSSLHALRLGTQDLIQGYGLGRPERLEGFCERWSADRAGDALDSYA